MLTHAQVIKLRLVTYIERRWESERFYDKSNENKELEYQLKVTVAKLSSLGISVEDITL